MGPLNVPQNDIKKYTPLCEIETRARQQFHFRVSITMPKFFFILFKMIVVQNIESILGHNILLKKQLFTVD